MAVKNPIVKAQFTKFIESEELSGHHIDEMFEMFSIYSVEQGFLNKNFEYSNIHFQGSEFGIDGVAIVVNNELVFDKSQLKELGVVRSAEFHFFQSKSGESFKTGDVNNFFMAIEEFFDDDFVSNSDDLNALHTIKEHIYTHSADLESSPSIKVFFVNTGNYNSLGPIEKAIVRLRVNLESTRYFGDIVIKIVDAGDLQVFYRNSVRSIERTITFKDSVVLPSASSMAASYLGFIEAPDVPLAL